MEISINESDLYRILWGSALLGSGGGGAIKAGQTFIDLIKASGKPITMLSFPLTKEEENQLACVLCDIGSINAFDEKQADALVYAYETLAAHFDHMGAIRSVVPIETGPENTLAPFVVAAKFGLSVLDGDGAGRAVPTLPLSTFSVAGIANWRPVMMSNGQGDIVAVNSHRFDKYDNLLRSLAHVGHFSDSASLAMWPDTVGALAAHAVPGTITRALHCGQLLEGIREQKPDLVMQSLPVVNQLDAYLIGAGTIRYANTSDSGGFTFSTVKIENQTDKNTLTILSQNESLLVYNTDLPGPVAMAPDSICFLGQDLYPYTNSEISDCRHPVYVIGIQAHQQLRHPIIMAGFRHVMEELGYAGGASVYTGATKPLGDLIVELSDRQA